MKAKDRFIESYINRKRLFYIHEYFISEEDMSDHEYTINEIRYLAKEAFEKEKQKKRPKNFRFLSDAYANSDFNNDLIVFRNQTVYDDDRLRYAFIPLIKFKAYLETEEEKEVRIKRQISEAEEKWENLEKEKRKRKRDLEKLELEELARLQKKYKNK